MAQNSGLEKAFIFLKRNKLSVFSTLSVDDGYPDSAMVYYLIDENKNILLLTTEDSRKINNLEKNSKVSMVVGHEVEPITVQIKGTARVVKDPNIIAKIFEPYLIKANNNPESFSFPPLTQLSKGKGINVIVIKIDKIKYSDFSNKAPFIYEGDLK